MHKISLSRNSFEIFDFKVTNTNIKRPAAAPPPFNDLKIMKGSLHVALKRDFADFAVNSRDINYELLFFLKMGQPRPLFRLISVI